MNASTLKSSQASALTADPGVPHDPTDTAATPSDLPVKRNDDVSGGRTDGAGQSGPPLNHNENLLEDFAEPPCAS
jgi:hypothetical protein